MNYEGEQVSLFDQDTWSGKTCPERSVPTAAKTSQPSWKKQSGSQSRKPPMCLCLKRDGQAPGAYTMTWGDGQLLGEYTTHSFGESPNEENVSRLSQILEAFPHQKYYLSAKACQGILNRASRRGKQLPENLRVALELQSQYTTKQQDSLQHRMGTGGNQIPLCFGIGNGQANEAAAMIPEKSQTLNTMHDTQAIYCPDVSHALKAKANIQCREDAETYPVQNEKVRRLTPLECERLQGFPDGWTDIGDWVDSKGKRHKEADTPRYKALGNSIAIPFWFWILRRISAQYARPATMGSLFDGIGGFPLCWEQCNGKGTARWASEIEEFPIAVTKVRFPEPVSAR